MRRLTGFLRLDPVTAEYVGLAFVLEPDSDETEVRASLRIEPDGWWGGYLIGPARLARDRVEHGAVLRAATTDGRTSAAFVASSIKRVPRNGQPSQESVDRHSGELGERDLESRSMEGVMDELPSREHLDQLCSTQLRDVSCISGMVRSFVVA